MGDVGVLCLVSPAMSLFAGGADSGRLIVSAEVQYSTVEW
jgi:hypothetical protein